jgi:hypothetical protein
MMEQRKMIKFQLQRWINTLDEGQKLFSPQTVLTNEVSASKATPLRNFYTWLDLHAVCRFCFGQGINFEAELALIHFGDLQKVKATSRTYTVSSMPSRLQGARPAAVALEL